MTPDPALSSAPQRHPARMEAVRERGVGVLQIELRLADTPPKTLAGQYLLIFHPDGTGIPFSIASAPSELPHLQLHYLHNPGSDDARRMDELLAARGDVMLELPHGDCGRTAELARPLIMIAGGTGVAQARSIAREIARHATQPLSLYWGARDAKAHYLREEFDALALEAPAFEWIAASETPADRCRTGMAADVVAEDLAAGRIDAAASDVLICGSPPMVWATVERLRPLGLRRERTYSDVFAYAPRDDIWED